MSVSNAINFGKTMKSSQTKHRQKGSVSIEFAVSILPFFVLLLALIEISRFMMVGSVIDVALVSATRQLVVTKAGQDLTGELKRTLSEQHLPLLNSSKMTVKARYFDSLTALANGSGLDGFQNQDFAEFTLVYPYQALFMPSQIDSFKRLTSFNRTILVTLERGASHGN
ncbi:pilus assembly protein [Moritella sp. 36]|uniref:TadE/TadG family type IV pilus assembly protein n=1 Tax=Moritella sp. 36 TaxID=2746233 RepID=UPI001BAC7F54|nr:TadE family protein [Moritella sp. 36]QUM88796.1 pilus assembly protein [Moritella sp. 36]